MPRISIIVFALALLVSCKKEGVKDATYKLVERESFAVQLPDWKVEVSEGGVGIGKYKVGRKGEYSAEVSWQGGQVLSLEDMDGLVTAMASGFELEISERSTTELPEQLRAHLVASVKGKVWMVMTMIVCKKTSMLVTLGFIARHRSDSEYMHNLALESFVCRGDAPIAGMQMPAVELDDSFGQNIESEMLLLINKTGETVVVIGSSSDTVKGARKYPDKTLRVFGEILETPLKTDGQTMSQKGLGGVEQWIVPAKEVRSNGSIPAIMGGYVCPDFGQGYLFIAQFDSSSTVETLSRLASKLGCPDEKTSPVQGRKTACEVGVTEYCESDKQ